MSLFLNKINIRRNRKHLFIQQLFKLQTGMRIHVNLANEPNARALPKRLQATFIFWPDNSCESKGRI